VIQLILAQTIAVCLVLLPQTAAQAAPKAELWPRWQRHDAANGAKIDHRPWHQFLAKYVVAGHPSGIHRVRYDAVTAKEHDLLTQYINRLEDVAISAYNPAEQKAYWINLYNAKTVELVLSRYPVRSIRDINISPGLFSVGPWGAKLLLVEGEKLSLDDIEHRILRPIWQDNRIHYAVNCASLGCPNMQPEAYTSDKIEALLEQGAREFINHPRGVALINGKLRVSSIYVWFQEDFGGSLQGLQNHWKKYAAGALIEALSSYRGSVNHEYDWRLNGAVPESVQPR
jgi:hypothetical protein